MAKLTRRRLLCATAPLAAAPLGVKLALGAEADAAGHDHEATPFSLLMVNHPILDYDQHTDRSLDEIFEDLGEIVI